MIDWSKLKPYDTDQKRSFEELCYQIARVKFDNKGIFTSVDDSGGGDGVEFYLTLPNGEEWGWQAKFYLDGRLVSGRKRSIVDSLEKSLKVHPNLKKWYLCVPMDLTVGEKEWFNNTLKSVVSEGVEVDLYFWGDSEFNYYLGTPELAGRKNYFFGDLELTMDWFNNQVSNQLSAIKGKYNPAVHTQTEVDSEIDSFLLNEGYKQQLIIQYQWLSHLIKEIEPLLIEIQKIETSNLPLMIKKDYLKYIKNTADVCHELLSLFKEEISFLRKDHYLGNRSLLFEEVLGKLFSSMSVLRKRNYSIENEYLDRTDETNELERRNIREIRSILWKPNENFEEIYYTFKDNVAKVMRSRSNNLNILGNAGYGKTHVTAHISRETIGKGLPAIFISGKNIVDSRLLSEQLLVSLDIPRNYSWSDFLQALDTSGKAFKTKIPIFIDGLNEVRDMSVVKNGLPGLIKEISSFENICLITTCRNTYVKPIFGEIPPNNVHLEGFLEGKLVEAVKVYFDYYKIKAEVSAISLEAFEHPLYLQIFCQTKNPERIYEKKVFINEQSMFDIFEAYIDQCNEKLSERLNLNPRRKIITKKLTNLGDALWKRNARSISVDEAEDILEYKQAPNWNESIEKNLTDENLLIYRDWYVDEDSEILTFTYDLLGGFIIAKHLLEENKERLREFLNDPNTVKLLFGEDYQSRHPLYEDISRCIAAMLPLYQGDYLIGYIKNQTTVNLTIESLFEMSPESINEKAKSLIKSLFTKPTNQKPLLKLSEKTLRQVSHPLNIYFWTVLLNDLSMAERDASWSEHIRQYKGDLEKEIDVLEQWCKVNQTELGSYEKEYLYLLAHNVMWTLTSTVRPLRDRATRALYYFGRAFPEKFFELLHYSFSINDPYVSERMLGALYGIGMAKQYEFEDEEFRLNILPVMAKTIYDLVFAEGARHFTTHILSRDYAKKFIEIGLIHHTALLTEDEKENISSPFNQSNGIEWGSLEKEEISDHGIGPMRMDFGNYTIGRLVKDRSNYDYEHEDFKNVRANIYWRIYNLGYSGELFEDIDSDIAEGNFRYGRSEDGRKTDRYGKKYSWIAFFEMAGYRYDLGILGDDWYQEECRISDLDIDPSFPVELPEVQIVKKEYFANQLPINEWLFGNCVPNFDDYLVMEEINGEKGPWVLLDGYFSDENKEQTRSCFFFPRGLLVKESNFEKIISLLRKQPLGGRWLPELPTDSYVYAGEIPWSDIYNENGETELEFVTAKVREPAQLEKRVLIKEGNKLTDAEEKKFMDRLVNEEKIGFISRFMNGLEAIEEHSVDLKPYGIKIEKEIIEQLIIKEEKEKINVLLPVRENNWGEGRSGIIPSRNVAIPTKELTDALGLINQPQTFDLYEKDGRKASMTVEFGENYRDRQQFTYLRQDLLNEFLDKEEYRLIWGLWGEKEISYKSEEFREYFHKRYGEVRKEFQEILIYEEKKKYN
ncbi:hypothetical protein CN533_04995 [Priestia megaterium]|uniref:NACHT domain-containing protein n=1 Tax=Priestia megaterium TaxID=1404 RepID=UPI000BF9542D|nr:hypothetical protein [Priestia megaterium]PET72763.1 hypothetical protein CN533_04995 [Priestia megaterium]PFK88883.1 hypothetical protein COJ19_04285 [Priestia megaterium]